jgi:Ion channel
MKRGRLPSARNEATENDREARALRRLLRSFRSSDSYGLVLVMIIATYILAVSLPARWGASVVLVVQIATVRLSLHTSGARRGLLALANVLFALAAAVAVANLFTERSALTSFVFVAACALYAVAPISIVRHIGYRRQVDQETMLGALAAYLLIGMAFAFMYRFLGSAQGGPFFGAEGEGTISEDLFFSFVTLTTTGYGDLVPAGNPGQSFAVFEALAGQLFLVTAVAKVVTAWRPRRWQEPSAGADATPDD